MAARILTLTFAVLLLPLILHAQSGQGHYLKIDYLDVDHSQLSEFTERIIPELRNHQSERIESGDISSWSVYRVVFAGSGADKYNYISITTAPEISAFDEFSTNQQDMILTYSEQDMYELSKTELWTVRNSIVNDMTAPPSNFLMMDYMLVRQGRELEYQMLEDEVAKPLHEQRLTTGVMEGWEMYQLVAPGGVNYGYNFATGNYFSELQHIEFGFNEELIRSQNPDVDLMDFFEQIWSTRDLIRSQTWQRVDYVTADGDS